MHFQSFVSDEEFKQFHTIDRLLYDVLVGPPLCRDPLESMHVMALWLWLERADAFNMVVSRILHCQPHQINDLADEAAAILAFLSGHRQDPASIIVSHTRNLIPGRPDILDILVQHPALSAAGVADIFNQVCVRALEDRKACAPSNRTLFVTFSRGYPVSVAEIRDFFASVSGDICQIERLSICTDLFAIIDFASEKAIDWVLGNDFQVKFTINGKQVRARKYVNKNSNPRSRQPNSPEFSPPPPPPPQFSTPMQHFPAAS